MVSKKKEERTNLKKRREGGKWGVVLLMLEGAIYMQYVVEEHQH
jgi:hypothetical protein